ncbi:MAG: hypothetical protein JSV94_01985 [Methanobacteriota archaeon]|nr:MAG: hypothetical protein JSV94_01985 [Euryarchaeota archaeon]
MHLQRDGMGVCTEGDCRLFKGMIRACDECRMYVALNEDGVDGRRPFSSRGSTD